MIVCLIVLYIQLYSFLVTISFLVTKREYKWALCTESRVSAALCCIVHVFSKPRVSLIQLFVDPTSHKTLSRWIEIYFICDINFVGMRHLFHNESLFVNIFCHIFYFKTTLGKAIRLKCTLFVLDLKYFVIFT